MILTHRPVPFDPNQGFAANPTQNNPDPTFGNYQPVGHLAVDFGCPEGTPIVAAASGTVVYAGWGQHMPAPIAAKYGYIAGAGGSASGIITIIDHGDGTATAYSHQSEIQVKAGQWVNGGQRIGAAGTTGRSTGPHLHFEYMVLPINYSSAYYSRLDPMKQFGAASIASLGKTTQEEDAPMSQAEVNQIIKAVAAEGDLTRKHLTNVTNDQHDLTREHLTNVTNDQHTGTRKLTSEEADLTRRHLINVGNDQEGATRQYLSERITEGAKPDQVADSVIAALGTDLAKEVVKELGTRLAGSAA